MAHNHGHNSGHDHGGGNIRAAFFLNLLFAFIELTGGIATNSIAIVSDAVHDFGDSLSLGLAWYLQRFSQKGSDAHYTYGYKRFSLLGAIVNSIVLFVGGVYILTESVPRVFAPQEVSATGMTILAAVGMAVNGAAFLRTRKASSINGRAVSLHMLEDIAGWGAVLLGSVVMRFTGLTIIDPLLSVAISLFVLFNVFRNIKQMLPILLQGTPVNIDMANIKKELANLDAVKDVHDLHVWSLDEETNVLTVHIALAEVLPAERLAVIKSSVRSVLASEGIQHATIEYEAPGEACALAG